VLRLRHCGKTCIASMCGWATRLKHSSVPVESFLKQIAIKIIMMNPTLDVSVRKMNPSVSVIDTRGEINATAQTMLSQAYAQATDAGARAIVLNFSHLDYMNSRGIGLIVTLLADARRRGQKLLAYGLSEHYRRIFALTRLDEAIGVFSDEAAAVLAGT
jgi:anti-sigma B factor antagonist